MRDFTKLSPKFWISKSQKKIRDAGPEAMIVALYLLSSPHSNMLGFYYLPLPLIAYETGLGLEGASKPDSATTMKTPNMYGYVIWPRCRLDNSSPQIRIVRAYTQSSQNCRIPDIKQCFMTGTGRLFI